MAQQRLVDIADRSGTQSVVAADLSLDRFLSALRMAWKGGEIRPTAQAKPKQKRGRRRPDPFALVTKELQAWFDEEPCRTSRELLERRPEQYPDQLLRTLQRRLEIWRKEKAHAMVFGAMQFEPAIEPMTN
ncbi:hypothetical protein [Mesorhizobium caraganae]|uniref:hypothetical protein n=1 Tax=Mesorhizobium caraganae TaxID=483206 RepID=UPI001784C3AB|nr:hypothetical protein [Mesorhizobium caraganae]